MGGVISRCCSCCDQTSKKSNESYRPTDSYNISPNAYDNELHFSKIYGINADDELAPSDNPKTETFFRSIIHPPKESTLAEDMGFPSTINPGESANATNTQSLHPNAKPPRAPLTASVSLKQSRVINPLDRTRSALGSKTLKHSNSCSTIYVDDSTVSQPNLRAMIKCVSVAVHSHILHRKSNKTMSIFDEKLHPLSRDPVPDDYDKEVPDQKVICRFMRNLFTAAQLTAECAIVTLVYLERVLSYGELDLCPSNWKRLVLGAIMLASKVWDDQAVWNVDFCQILKEIAVNEMNELEREYIQVLQFNVDVASSIYAKYYFDLRQIAKENQISFPDELLTKEKAIKLEALSLANNRLQQPFAHSAINSNSGLLSMNMYQGSSQSKTLAPQLSLRRSASVEFVQSPRKSLLILS